MPKTAQTKKPQAAKKADDKSKAALKRKFLVHGSEPAPSKEEQTEIVIFFAGKRASIGVPPEHIVQRHTGSVRRKVQAQDLRAGDRITITGTDVENALIDVVRETTIPHDSGKVARRKPGNTTRITTTYRGQARAPVIVNAEEPFRKVVKGTETVVVKARDLRVGDRIRIGNDAKFRTETIQTVRTGLGVVAVIDEPDVPQKSTTRITLDPSDPDPLGTTSVLMSEAAWASLRYDFFERLCVEGGVSFVTGIRGRHGLTPHVLLSSQPFVYLARNNRRVTATPEQIKLGLRVPVEQPDGSVVYEELFGFERHFPVPSQQRATALAALRMANAIAECKTLKLPDPKPKPIPAPSFPKGTFFNETKTLGIRKLKIAEIQDTPDEITVQFPAVGKFVIKVEHDAPIIPVTEEERAIEIARTLYRHDKTLQRAMYGRHKLKVQVIRHSPGLAKVTTVHEFQVSALTN